MTPNSKFGNILLHFNENLGIVLPGINVDILQHVNKIMYKTVCCASQHKKYWIVTKCSSMEN